MLCPGRFILVESVLIASPTTFLLRLFHPLSGQNLNFQVDNSEKSLSESNAIQGWLARIHCNLIARHFLVRLVSFSAEKLDTRAMRNAGLMLVNQRCMYVYE